MRRLSIAIAAVASTACAGAQEIPFVPGQGSAEKLSPAERDVARLAIDALAEDLEIARERIQVDTIRAVDWPDSSLGCPQPGRAYLQVITPGHKVTLRAEGGIHVVHEAKGRAFVCHKTKPYAGIDPKLEFTFGPQLVDARKDLAARLGVPESEIKPWSAKEQTWDDAGLGCPEPGKSYPSGKVTGWVLSLKHDSREYTYHTDLHRTVPCPPIAAE
jgi:hypothetical protein